MASLSANCITQGVIIGTTKEQEWLLPWWWFHYRLYNTYPVTFIDFGDMSEKSIEWCKKRGGVIKLAVQPDFVAPREKVAPELVTLWESIHPQMWFIRKTWYKKPFAMLQSPYRRTIWLDLDCQTRGSLKPLFEFNLGSSGITLAAEDQVSQDHNLKRTITIPGEIAYNAGVVVFDRDSSLLKEWTQQCIHQSHLFFGDSQLLSRMIMTQKIAFNPLPTTYNWVVSWGLNSNALILHWSGSSKAFIENQIEFFGKGCLIDLTKVP